jgi:hypothetical protein
LSPETFSLFIKARTFNKLNEWKLANICYDLILAKIITSDTSNKLQFKNELTQAYIRAEKVSSINNNLPVNSRVYLKRIIEIIKSMHFKI